MVLLLASLRSAELRVFISRTTLRAAVGARLRGIPTVGPHLPRPRRTGVRSGGGGGRDVRRRRRRLRVRRLGDGPSAPAGGPKRRAARARTAVAAGLVPAHAARVRGGDLGSLARPARPARRVVVPEPRRARLERPRRRVADLRQRAPAEGRRVVPGAARACQPVALLLRRPGTGLRGRGGGDRKST